jgi:hypothetical protein
MDEINNREPVEITSVLGPYAFKIRHDTTTYGKYSRQGTVESIKVPSSISFNDLSTSYKNPVASAGGYI